MIDSTPVHTVGYFEKLNLTEDMVFSGETALAEKLKETCLIPFKAKAWNDLSERKGKGDW